MANTSPEPQPDRVYYLTWLVAAAACALTFTVLTTVIDRRGEIINANDPIEYFSYTRSMVIDHDVNLANEFERLHVPSPVSPATGYPTCKYSIGFPLLVAPVVALVHAVILLLNLAGLGLDADGYSTPYRLAFCFGSIGYGYLGLILSYRLCRRLFSATTSFIAVSSIFLCSNLPYYFVREPSVSHLTSFCMVSLFLYTWYDLTKGRQAGKCLTLGISAGLITLIRQQEVAFLIIPLVDAVRQLTVRQKESRPWFCDPGNLGAAAVGFGVVVALQLYVWYAIFGSVFTYSYQGFGFSNALSPKIFSVLFSSRHGLISWHPIILFSLAGIALLLHARHRVALPFLAAFLLQLYISGSWCEWWFGSSFGHRAFIGCTPIFVVGLAATLQFLQDRKVPRWSILAGMALLATWNLVLALAYLSEAIPYNDFFNWGDFLLRLPHLPNDILTKIGRLR